VTDKRCSLPTRPLCPQLRARSTQFTGPNGTQVSLRASRFVAVGVRVGLMVGFLCTERPQFEWTPVLNINHSFPAIRSMQFAGNFFVSEVRVAMVWVRCVPLLLIHVDGWLQARKNNRSFASLAEEGEYVIYNWAPTTGHMSYQHYKFPPSTP